MSNAYLCPHLHVSIRSSCHLEYSLRTEMSSVGTRIGVLVLFTLKNLLRMEISWPLRFAKPFLFDLITFLSGSCLDLARCQDYEMLLWFLQTSQQEGGCQVGCQGGV
jgi:hypothetical protein